MEIKVESFSIEGLNIEYDDKKSITEDAKKRMSAMFIAVREKSGMNRKEFAEWLGIPYRTMQDWERGVSQVPDYVLRLVAYKVKMEDYLKRGILKYDDREDNR